MGSARGDCLSDLLAMFLLSEAQLVLHLQIEPERSPHWFQTFGRVVGPLCINPAGNRCGRGTPQDVSSWSIIGASNQLAGR